MFDNFVITPFCSSKYTWAAICTKIYRQRLLSEYQYYFWIVDCFPVTSVCCKRSFSALRRLKIWVWSTMMGKRLCGLAILHSHRNMAVNRETDMMPLAIGKLEDFLWTTKTCSNLNSSYNYIKHICFELSFLTVIPVLHTKTLNWLITTCVISICSQLNTTRQKKAGLYIFCVRVRQFCICRHTYKARLKDMSNDTKIVSSHWHSLCCSGTFNWMFLHHLVSVTVISLFLWYDFWVY